MIKRIQRGQQGSGEDIDMIQKFMMYDGKDTHSGLYVFNPIHEATEV